MPDLQSIKLSGQLASSYSMRRAGSLTLPWEVNGLELQAACPFQWIEAPQSSQVTKYLPHISRHIQKVLDDKKCSRCMMPKDFRHY